MAVQGVDSYFDGAHNTTKVVEWRRNGWVVPATGAAIEIMASSWLVGGVPGCAAGTPATGAGETCDRSTLGALPLPAAAAGQSIYLLMMNLAALAYALFKLYDRLVQTSGLDGSTTAEVLINTVDLPARGGTGEGAMPFAEVYAVTGTPVAVNITLRYLNELGVEKTAVTTGVVLSTIGRYIPLNLAPGDKGVRKVIGRSLSGATGGTVNWGITLARLVALNATAGANWAAEPKNATDQGGPLIDDNACLFVAGMFGVLSTGTAAHGSINLMRK